MFPQGTISWGSNFPWGEGKNLTLDFIFVISFSLYFQNENARSLWISTNCLSEFSNERKFDLNKFYPL
jgi:hypothetical protein